MLWPRWIWLRALGLIFLSVFYSLAFQIEGLVGPRGILPAGEYLPEVREAVGAWKAAWYAPRPDRRSWLKLLTITTPLSTAWPKRAMKPIAAETLRWIPVR